MKRRAFTLLEIVIVVSIILLLVGLFAPAVWHFYKFVRQLANPQ